VFSLILAVDPFFFGLHMHFEFVEVDVSVDVHLNVGGLVRALHAQLAFLELLPIQLEDAFVRENECIALLQVDVQTLDLL